MQFEVRRDPPSHLGPDPSTLLKRVKRGPAERNITIWPCLPHQVWAALKCVADLYSVNEGWRFGTGAKVFLYIYRIHPNPSIFNIYFKTWLWSLSWWFILMMRRIIINIILITLTAMTIACHFITIIINYHYSYYNISLLLIVIEIIIRNIILEERICRALGGAGLGGVSHLATLNRYFWLNSLANVHWIFYRNTFQDPM